MPKPPTDSSTRRSRPARAEGRRTPGGGLAHWLSEHLPAVCEEWRSRIRSRGVTGSSEWDEVVTEFVSQIGDLLPHMLGPYKREVEPLWARLAELFGAAAAQRGLAAGEVIEELQILRELLIRGLHQAPPRDGQASPSLRDVLIVNRAVDRAVTHGSVGHTDALFFELFERDEEGVGGSPKGGPPEVHAQLQAIRTEARAVLPVSPAPLEDTTH